MIAAPPRPDSMPSPVKRKPRTQAERVRAGAQLLDRKVPGWAARINPEELDIQATNSCVVGQLYGQYWDGLEKLGALLSQGRYGFDVAWDVQPPEEPVPALYAELTELWRAEIARRIK